MRDREFVTFGTSHLDRSADVRSDPGRIADLLCDGTTRVLPLWRGKPVLSPDDDAGWVPPDHSVLSASDGSFVFLGLDERGAAFAADISAWTPQELPGSLGAFHDPSEQVHPELPEGYRFVELRQSMIRLTRRDAELAATAKSLLGWHETHRFCARCGEPTEMIEGGWQRLCDGCGARHFPRTDPVVIMLVTRHNSLLLGRSPGWPEGMFSLLAGFVEPGETLEAAVRRETYEESRIVVGEVRYLACQPWPFPSSLMLGCWGKALSDDITLDPNELDNACWVTREEMAAILRADHAIIRPPREGAIARFLIEAWLRDNLG